MIKAIIFDLGGVVLDIDISKTNQAFRDLGFDNIDEYFGLGHAGDFFRDYEDGTIGDEEFVQRIAEMLGGRIGYDKIIDAWNSLLLQFPPKRIKFLEQLKGHYRLFLFSNTNGIHLNAFHRMFREAFDGRELDTLFEKVYYSHVAGFRKPDAKGFQEILKENALEPGETIFIDDAKVNVEAAERLGIQGIWLEPGKSIEDLDL